MGITAGLVVVFRGIPAAFAGLALAHASQLSGILQNTVRWASETETRFTSVQRMENSLNRLEVHLIVDFIIKPVLIL
jgi:ATP-binding cassette subfamily C (CFTR/MRP) protein 5